jgi:hypothetical protein
MISYKSTVAPGVCDTRSTILVDAHADGISIARLSNNPGACSLGLDGEDGEPTGLLRSRYSPDRNDPVLELERKLSRLSSRGELRRSTVVLGSTTDPFHPFDEKFAMSMKFLQLFERFVPGRLIIQTRSPLIVIGVPVLKRVRENTYVMMAIETNRDDLGKKYAPEAPLPSERLKAIRTLRHFGMRVGIQVAPLLPYGDWRKDAHSFGEFLNFHADFIHIRGLTQLSSGNRPKGYAAQLLAQERNFHWLRTDAHVPVVNVLKDLAPHKLLHPIELAFAEPQIGLFNEQGMASGQRTH